MISAFGIDHVVSKAMGYGSTFGAAARGLPKEARRLRASAKLGKQGRLKRREELGRAFKATGGEPRHSESRPGPWAKQSRAAWDKGYRGG